ncbi:MAG: hypothetical protein M1833_004182 [Piccolia ochrophora]|nr:MAG: hypothetical protein M1833_004182 [Piccolia ochrophora]
MKTRTNFYTQSTWLWLWIFRIFQLVVTSAVLGVAAADVIEFTNAKCNMPAKLGFNLAVAGLAFLCTLYLILSTGKTPLLPHSPFVQLPIDFLLLILWIGAAVTAKHTTKDVCTACYPELVLDHCPLDVDPKTTSGLSEDFNADDASSDSLWANDTDTRDVIREREASLTLLRRVPKSSSKSNSKSKGSKLPKFKSSKSSSKKSSAEGTARLSLDAFSAVLAFVTFCATIVTIFLRYRKGGRAKALDSSAEDAYGPMSNTPADAARQPLVSSAANYDQAHQQPPFEQNPTAYGQPQQQQQQWHTEYAPTNTHTAYNGDQTTYLPSPSRSPVPGTEHHGHSYAAAPVSPQELPSQNTPYPAYTPSVSPPPQQQQQQQGPLTSHNGAGYQTAPGAY